MRFVLALGLALGTAASAAAHLVVDVGVAGSAPEFVAAGAPITYTIRVTDLAYDPAFGVIMDDRLPSGAKYLSAAASGGWSCSESKGTVSCSAETLTSGVSTITINATAPSQTGLARDTATLTSLGSLDPVSSNDTANVDTTVFAAGSCSHPAPSLAGPDDGAELPGGVVEFHWTAVGGAAKYRVWVAVEGAKPFVLGETDGIGLDAILETGLVEWWVEATFATCPSTSSAHSHVQSFGRPYRLSVADYAGSAEVTGHADGPRAQATFESPSSIGVDVYGNLFVADSASSVIRQIKPDGTVTTLVGKPDESGALDGSGDIARMTHPRAIAVAAGGYTYVADTDNQLIRQLYPNGNGVVFSPFLATLAGSPSASGATDGVGGSARFNQPGGVAVTPAYSVLISDTNNHRIRKLVVSTAAVTTVADGFSAPSGLALDDAGNLFIADSGNHTISRLSPDGQVTLFAGAPGVAGFADGLGTGARFQSPSGLAFDALGNLYVADTGNHAVRRIAPSGLVTTVIGTGDPGHLNGAGSVAHLNAPTALAVDGTGRVFIADRDNHMIRIATGAAQAGGGRRRAAGR